MASANKEEICFADVRGRHLLVALSGGADSVALLCLLHARRAQDELRLTAAHFHHGIRGADADADLRFCRALCRRLDLPLIEGGADVPSISRARGVGMETAARDARYAFLERSRAQCGADCIALAHHMDDQAETVLMHLLRGSGGVGVCGMARWTNRLYRPLLGVRKKTLMQFLEAEGISWREDATNAISDTPRNALRLHVMPEIERSYPSAAAAIARYASIARVESDYLEKIAARFCAERVETGAYGRRIRLDGGEDEAVFRRAVRRLCSISGARTDALTELWRAGRGRLEISGECIAERTPEWLYLLPKAQSSPEAVRLKPSGVTTLANVCRIRAEAGVFPMERESRRTELFNPSALEGAVLRTRRAGDRFHPLGAPGDRLLSDFLIDLKVDRPLRDWLPLVAVGDRVLWVCGLRPSADARIEDERATSVRLTMDSITDEKNGGQ